MEGPVTKDEGLIYGINPLLEALRSGGRRFNKIYLLKGRRDKDIDEIVLLAKRLGATIYYEPREILDRIAPHKRHQGAVGMVSPKEYATIEDILDAARSRDEVPFILIIDGIDDPRNLGAIIRSAEGAGVHGIVIPERRSAGITDLVSKASAGAVEYMPVARVVNIVRVIDLLKDNGLWIIGLDAGGVKSYLEFDYSVPIGAVIGNEGSGIRRLALERCDEVVSIPCKGRVSSLNVSVAASIFAYEVLRQRRAESKDGRSVRKS